MSKKELKWEITIIIVLLIGFVGNYLNYTSFYIFPVIWDNSTGHDDTYYLKYIIVGTFFPCFFSKILLGAICDRYEVSRFVFICTSLSKLTKILIIQRDNCISQQKIKKSVATLKM